VNVNCFFSVESEDVGMGGVLGGLPKVKPTGLPRLPPEVPGVVVSVDAPKVNFPVDGNPPNGEGDVVGLSLSELVPPKRLEEDVEVPNPPNGLGGLSVLVLPNPPNTLVVDFSEAPDGPKRDGVVLLSFSLSSLNPNAEVFDGPPNKLVVVEEEDPPKRDPEDVELEARFPNDEDGLGLSLGGSSVVFFAREEAKKLGMAEVDLLSDPGVLPKPKVGAGGPPEDSEVGAGVGENVNPVDGFEPSVVVGGVKPLGFEPKENVLEFVGGLNPEAGGVGVDNLGAAVVVDGDVFDRLGALNRIDGPGSGPSGSVFLGELLKEPVSCLSHTDWMARRLAAY
jgi:hypothetical protein